MFIQTIYLLLMLLVIATSALGFKLGYEKGAKDVQESIKSELCRMEEEVKYEHEVRELMFKSRG